MWKKIAGIFAACVFCSPLLQAQDERGLAAHWPLDEGQGTVPHDRSGNGNDGQIKGATWVRNGAAWALEFDGKDDCVDCGAGKSLDLRKQVSLVAWVWAEPRSQAGEPGIVGKKFASYLITQYHEQAWTYISGGPHNAKAALPAGQWHHVASTYDGTTLKLYIDGALLTTNTLNLPIGAGGHFWMGRSDGALKYTRNAHFRGKLADVRVYDRPLSAQEVARLMRTTQLTQTVAVSCTPVPTGGRLLVQLDARGLGAMPEGLLVNVALHKLDAAGQPLTQALATASARRFDAQSKAVLALPMGRAAAGRYLVRVAAKGADGQTVGLPSEAACKWVSLPEFPRGPQGARQLNNLVCELLSVSDASGKSHSFSNPRKGWIFISSRGANEVELTAQATGQTQRLALDEEHADARETMRLLDAGAYTIAAPKAAQLTVRAIPEIVFARYDSNPHVKEFGAYKGKFHKRHVFKNVNTFVGTIREPFAKQWQQRGRKWLVRCGVPKDTKKKPLTVDVAYDYITKNGAFNTPHIAGLIADEYGNSAPHCATWAKALEKAWSQPQFKGIAYYPYAGDFWTGPEGIELTATLVKHGSAIAWKRYLKEQRTEVDAWRFLNHRLVNSAEQYRAKCPGSLPHLVVCFGYFSAPPEQLDTFPHVNYKTYLDMQLNIVATHPAFADIGGIMSYLASYADEETVRWMLKLFRHYGIEGKTEMFSRDPYMLTHLGNGDFEHAGEGWTLAPAEPNGIRFGISFGFGWLQGRYPHTNEGNTVLIAKRCAAKPNVFSQTIEDLTPGRLYSFRMYSADFNDMATKQKHAVTVKLERVELLPDQCFTHVFPNCYSHRYGPFDRKHRAWMNYHWRVFRAKATSAKLTVSDWSSADSPGGPVGQELMFNFVQVQPYDAR